MKTIYKYPIKVQDEQTVEIPFGAKILCVQIQDNTPCLWAMVDTENQTEHRLIRTIGTGHELRPFDSGRSYIGTYQLGGFVGHVFQESWH